jgi:hypothetical protein
MPLDRSKIAGDFAQAVNMSADELDQWLETDESKSAGQKIDGGESIGHASGRRIVRILCTPADELEDADFEHMRKTVGYIRRHLTQEPANPLTSRWRYSLKNWGHDPMI